MYIYVKITSTEDQDEMEGVYAWIIKFSMNEMVVYIKSKKDMYNGMRIMEWDEGNRHGEIE